jgi:uncharacterized protein GlcG (DUF336 family)
MNQDQTSPAMPAAPPAQPDAPLSRRAFVGATAAAAIGLGALATAQAAPTAQDPPDRQLRDKRPLETSDISEAQAHQVLIAARERAIELGCKMDIAVVDAGGNLKAFTRMDGAWLGSIDIAIKKARTARLFDMSTGEIGKLSQPGEPLYNIELSNGGLISFPGGVPIRTREGVVIGAIGVSGSTVENDHACAAAGTRGLE